MYDPCKSVCKSDANKIIILIMSFITRLWNVYKKIGKLDSVLAYFTMRTWTFSNRNVHSLWNKLSEHDKKNVMFDMKQLNWNDFFLTYVSGCRVYLAKDPMSTLPQAQVRWRRWVQVNCSIMRYITKHLSSILKAK